MWSNACSVTSSGSGFIANHTNDSPPIVTLPAQGGERIPSFPAGYTEAVSPVEYSSRIAPFKRRDTD